MILILTISVTQSIGQLHTYEYQCDLTVNGTLEGKWAALIVPSHIYANTNKSLSDIRIYELTATDTIENPYIIQQDAASHKTTEVPFEIINQSKGDGEYYYTFQLSNRLVVDQIQLDFKERNFDYSIQLEAGQTLDALSVVLDNYRILSFDDRSKNYIFTTLSFGASDYMYYKLTVPSDKEVNLQSAILSITETKEVQKEIYQIDSKTIRQDKQWLSTVIKLELDEKAPINSILIDVESPSEYYRPIIIEGLVDSFKTQKGYIRNYKNIYQGTLSSLEDNKFDFASSTHQQLRITIKNYDSPPVQLGVLSISGIRHKIYSKLKPTSKYIMSYGKQSARSPRYDLQYFKGDLPKSIGSLTIGNHRRTDGAPINSTQPLITNQIWLWLALILLVLLLGWSTLKMLKKEG